MSQRLADPPAPEALTIYRQDAEEFHGLETVRCAVRWNGGHGHGGGGDDHRHNRRSAHGSTTIMTVITIMTMITIMTTTITTKSTRS